MGQLGQGQMPRTEHVQEGIWEAMPVAASVSIADREGWAGRVGQGARGRWGMTQHSSPGRE